MNAPRWSDQQSQALSNVALWHRQASQGVGPQVYRVFGYAGSGKSTLARHFARQIDGKTVYAAFTGKAALVMQRAGAYGASTIHSLIYKVDDTGPQVRFVLNPESAAAEASLIVIDEVSMVDEALARDLLSFRRPILVLGDPAQLPPVRGAGFFTEAKPDVMLTEIHRQARDNPIIRMATDLREGNDLPLGDYGDGCRVVPRGALSEREVLGASQVLVGLNRTRKGMNAKMRRILGFTSEFPETGDRLVCLKNDKGKGIFNGGTFTVERRGTGKAKMPLVLASDDFPDRGEIEVDAWPDVFSREPTQDEIAQVRDMQIFDFGYALTVHKAQGSQWDEVIVYDEAGFMKNEAWRWRYTAATRAAKKLTIVRG